MTALAGRLVRIAVRLLLLAAPAAWAVWVAAQLVRDLNPWAAVFFYVPAPFMAAFLLAAASTAWLGRRRVVALAFVLMAAVPAAYVVSVDNRWSRPERGGGTLRLVHWNICWASGGWRGIKEFLRRQEADIYVLSEIPERADMREVADFAEPGCDVRRLDDLAVIARGSLSDPEWIARDGELRLCDLEWRFRGETVRLFVADVSSSLARGRGPVLEEIVQQIELRGPDLVVGDFNAPRRSRGLCPLPAGYVHGYEAAGRGWSYTWPVPCPMLAIDQCICGSRVEPVHFDLTTSLHSDHRLQVLDFRLHRSKKREKAP